jgi:FlaA1/EpsC-like NDP-sugar epimerase
LKKGCYVSVLSRDENKQFLMSQKHPEVKFFLGDVRNYDDCLKATRNQDIVIHAAALKRIEFGEREPFQFIQTNILGTNNIVDAARENDVTQLILISTDKACEPINVYGMCKALAEKIVLNAGYNCVRYGNVNGSRGSVFTIWKEQIARKEPITITNPDMSRFMISLEQAIGIIEIALDNPFGGKIFVPKLKSAYVGDLAKLFSKKQKRIKMRKGEKMHEVLISSHEIYRTKDFGSYFVIYEHGVEHPVSYPYVSGVGSNIKGNSLKEEIKEFL